MSYLNMYCLKFSCVIECSDKLCETLVSTAHLPLLPLPVASTAFLTLSCLAAPSTSPYLSVPQHFIYSLCVPDLWKLSPIPFYLNSTLFQPSSASPAMPSLLAFPIISLFCVHFAFNFLSLASSS